MDKANKTVVNLNLKDFSDGPEDYANSRNKYIKISADEAGIEFVDSHELIHEARASQDLARSVSRVSQIESELQEMSIEHDILLNRVSPNSNFIYDSFYDESKIDHPTQLSDNPVEVMDDHDWNNNWKFDIQKQIYKQGFARPQKRYYMLELIDRYNLAGIGLSRKNKIEYDATNECYWFLSCNGENAIGTITKLSPQLRDGKVEVIGQWYLPASGAAATFWDGMCSDGTNLYISRSGLTTLSFVYCIPINSDGTLGVKTPTDYSKKNGETIALGTSTFWQHTNALTGYITDVTNWDTTYIVGFVTQTGSAQGTLSMIRKSDGGTSPLNNITEFHRFVGGTDGDGRAICRRGDVLWMMYNDRTDDNRMIYKFNISTDIANNKVFKCSGGFFRPALDIDAQTYNTEGITVDQDGNIITVSSTASSGTQLNKMAHTNALWAENQQSALYMHTTVGTSFTIPNTPLVIGVEANRYYWTSDSSVPAAVDVYRFDTVTGTCLWLRITALESGTAWQSIYSIVVDDTNNKLYFLGHDNAGTLLYKVYHGSLSAFVALMVDTGGAGANITLGTTWGAAATGIGSGPGYTTTDRLHGMTLNSDDGILYITNDTDQKIDTLSLDGATYTQGVYHLPARANEAWFGLAYKNNKIYIVDKQYSTAGPSYLYVMDITRATSTTWYMVHRHMDPSQKYFASSTFHGIAFDGNDLVVCWCNTTNMGRFIKMKTLEDPDVIQIHTFLTEYNVLLTPHVLFGTSIAKRYFEPDQFADVRDIPDQYYMAVTYENEGFSVLHLDEFLGDASSTGQHRYDPRKIRAWHYKKNTPAPYNIVGITTGTIMNINIEKDIIIVAVYITTGTPLIIIDLKSGKAYYMSTGAINRYDGTLTERNDGKGYTQITTTVDLTMSSNINQRLNSRTFFKNDQSDYAGEYPKTFVLTGGPGGSDVIEIEWDQNNNRTIKKVWKNILNLAGSTPAGYIAPSGQIFIGRDIDYAGNIYMPISNTNNEPLKVWDLATQYSYVSLLAVGGAVRDFGPNSRCWKTKSGQWRHQFIISSYRGASTGSSVNCIIDVENKTYELVYSNASGTDMYCMGLDSSEDMIFARRDYYSAAYISDVLRAFKKRRFYTNRWTELYNNWDLDSPEGYYLTMYATSPRFSSPIVNFGGTGNIIYHAVIYNMNFSALLNGQYAWGAQFFHYPWADESKYYGKEFEISDPSEFIYKQSNIIPEV